MVQKARPSADVSNDGWAPTPVFVEIDEPVPDDGTYVESSSCLSEFTVRLSRLAAPAAGPGEAAHALTVRLAGSTVVLVELLQGEEVIAWDTFTPGAGFAPYTLALTRQEAAKIRYGSEPDSDPDLRVRVTALGDCGSGSGVLCAPGRCPRTCEQCSGPTGMSRMWTLTFEGAPEVVAHFCLRAHPVDGNGCVMASADPFWDLRYEPGAEAWVLTNLDDERVWVTAAWDCCEENTLISDDPQQPVAIVTPNNDCCRYACVGGECVSWPDGPYATLEECQAACELPSYDCVGGACVEVEGGPYATLEECQAACGGGGTFPGCAEAPAEMSFAVQSNCECIDGYSGTLGKSSNYIWGDSQSQFECDADANLFRLECNEGVYTMVVGTTPQLAGGGTCPVELTLEVTAQTSTSMTFTTTPGCTACGGPMTIVVTIP